MVMATACIISSASVIATVTAPTEEAEVEVVAQEMNENMSSDNKHLLQVPGHDSVGEEADTEDNFEDE